LGQSCGNCYGEGQVATDGGPITCPDCGGTGSLPAPSVIVEWRAGEIERVHGIGSDQIAQDVRWLVFELRRARSALTTLLALASELPDDPATAPATAQMRFVANDALGLYAVAHEQPRGS
jgi:hypothetical protein